MPESGEPWRGSLPRPAEDLAPRLAAVLARIERACLGVGRRVESVQLVAVSKTMPLERVQAAWAAGLRDFGENRVQEAEPKIRAMGRAAPSGLPDAPRWHLVGHLQSNKAGRAVELFDLIQSVDDLDLVQVLSRRAQQLPGGGKRQAVLIQVNCSEEAAKSGCPPERALALAEAALAAPGLRLQGFMTIGPLERDDPAAAERGARRAFSQLREIRDAAERQLGTPLPELSMGMSGDLEVAIEEGATLVRIGTALFGSRP